MADFEWDPAKDAANLDKPGIGFARASDVFEDPLWIEEDATRPEHGEQRRLAIGRVGDGIIAVIFTDREGRVRIIAARRARRDERRRYGRRAAAG